MEIEKNVLVVVIDLAKKNDVIALESVLVKKISEKCLTIFNADPSMKKTAKSKLLQSFSSRFEGS